MSRSDQARRGGVASNYNNPRDLQCTTNVHGNSLTDDGLFEGRSWYFDNEALSAQIDVCHRGWRNAVVEAKPGNVNAVIFVGF
jgi:hypothetical protein